MVRATFMQLMRRSKIIIMTLLILHLTACQSTVNNSRVIASVFNASTTIQQKMIERHAPTQIQIQRNLVYQQQPELHLDVYHALHSERASRPTVVWIHGGGWISGSKTHASGYFKRLAAQGFNIISLQYQFAPQAIYPTQLQQVDRALRYITTHAKDLNIDAAQLYLAGDSAGANLASHYAALVSNPKFAHQSHLTPFLKREQLKGLILHCGIYDLASFVATATDEMHLLTWGIYNLVQAYTGEKKDDVEFLASISPRQHITEDYPPVLISGGNKDFLTDSQSVPFALTLKQHGIAVTEVFYPDTTEFLVHEYQFMMTKKASQQTFERTLTFIRQQSALAD